MHLVIIGRRIAQIDVFPFLAEVAASPTLIDVQTLAIGQFDDGMQADPILKDFNRHDPSPRNKRSPALRLIP